MPQAASFDLILGEVAPRALLPLTAAWAPSDRCRAVLVAGRLALLATPAWPVRALALLLAALWPSHRVLDSLQEAAGGLALHSSLPRPMHDARPLPALLLTTPPDPPPRCPGIFVYLINRPTLAGLPTQHALVAWLVLLRLRPAVRHAAAAPLGVCYWLLTVLPVLASLLAIIKLIVWPLGWAVGWAAWPPAGGLPALLNLCYVCASSERWLQRACQEALQEPFGPATRISLGRIAAASRRNETDVGWLLAVDCRLLLCPLAIASWRFVLLSLVLLISKTATALICEWLANVTCILHSAGCRLPRAEDATSLPNFFSLLCSDRFAGAHSAGCEAGLHDAA